MELLVRKYDIEMVVVSMGRGALFIDKAKAVLAHALDVEVQSTVGAGDSMVAALAYSIGNGLDYESMIRLAVASAAARRDDFGFPAGRPFCYQGA